MRWTRDYTPQPDQSRLFTQALVITLGGNILLAAAKALVAYLTGSVAIYADAANSISDVVYSLLMAFGLWVAQRPPDLSHPQGHNRFEPLVGMAVTFSMAFAGFEAARAAITRLVEGGSPVDPGLPTLVLVSGAVVKAFMFWRIRWIARRLDSPTLATTARDNLSDVLTSTAALVGAVGSTFVHPLTDPIAGVLVALWSFRNVARAGKENLDFLTGAGADPDLRERLVSIAEAVPGVQRVHHMMTEYTGTRLVVDLHVNVDGSMTLRQAHDIADQIIERLQEQPEVDRAYVHIEPEGYD